ncbi:alginate O-acetyltransferase AlgX-related protein [Croceimicrobium hydrocarbonivorans]|uniref:AlgX/AlgJ SGNH hydrolase-like domain-containing protein n=1 Tax=Croceimicrobium hydrocarbonivorans TaxID=2761580 RepID=A0A7H0VHI0_9FLAO|nr:hypothetical protein [Croceimicrobium hydrocarbonivorans]QNR25178.1 hypothetical protein H4K34_04885 [Croceimicrobium hydrocarbonivorans]
MMMKKFVLKIAAFCLPFIGLYLINRLMYDPTEGDLARLAYLYNNPCPRTEIRNQFQLEKKYHLLSEINLEEDTHFDVLIIGDSFSEQGKLGYKNFLAHQGLSVLHVDRYISGINPIQSLIELSNSRFFERVKVDYVVLQSVERSFNQITQDLDFNASLNLDSLQKRIEEYQNIPPKLEVEFFSDALFKIPLNNLQYLYSAKPPYSQTYIFPSSRPELFSHEPKNILIYEEDIQKLDTKNNADQTKYSIEALGKIDKLLKQQGIKLLSLISPDKYDLYYPYLSGKEQLEMPLFFSHYNAYPKPFTSVKAFEILQKQIASEKDIYYYDDTHWSPKGAQLVADEILSIISKANH